MRVYSVFDKAVGAYDRPFYARQDGEAVRIFQDAINQKDSPFFKHPNDFELYALGAFDEASGELLSQVRRLIAAIQLVENVA